MGDLIKGLRVDGAETAQEWMTKLAVMLNGSPKQGWGGFRKEPLNTFPIGMFVDSMHGAQGADRSKKIKQLGAPTRDFSEIARITTDWFPDFSTWLSETAATMFFILHLKPNQDGGWASPGGKSKDFFSSYTIHLRSPRKSVNDDKTGEIGFYMQMHKDSYGPGGVSIPMSMKWNFQEDGRQYTYFDWEGCTCKMFEIWTGSTEHAMGATHPIRKHLAGFGKKQAGNLGLKYTLPGVTGAEEYLSPREFNIALEENTEYREELDRLTHITKRLATHEYFNLKARMLVEAAEAKRKGALAKAAATRRANAKAAEKGPKAPTTGETQEAAPQLPGEPAPTDVVIPPDTSAGTPAMETGEPDAE